MEQLTLRQGETKTYAAIEAPLKHPLFANELAGKVVWLAGRQAQFAELTLNPQQMGALEVRLTVSGGEATAQFFSPNPLVREVIDAALPKLRELMAQAGLTLGEAEVRDQAFSRQEHAGSQHGNGTKSQNGREGVASALASMGMQRPSALGLVDLFI
jgi:flagellar hook-length control protein FliK